MDALVKTAIEALVKKILPLLEQQLAGVLDKSAERPPPELAYLINESRELLDLMSTWTASHQGKTAPKAQVEEPELSDDEAMQLMASMDENGSSDELNADEAAAMMAEMNDSPKAPVKAKTEDLTDDEAEALLAEMDDSPKAATKAPAKKEELSDDEAEALLAEMDGQAPASDDDELSDDEASALLAEMEAPMKKKPPVKTASQTPAKPMGDDEASRLLAEMEDEPAAPAAQAAAPKAAAPVHSSHAEDGEDLKEIPEWEPNDFQSDPSMLNDFITNSDELMQMVDDAILRLEQDPTNKGIIEEIFRAAHTLKGGSGMFGFKGIERVMHRMENLFDLIRKDKLVPTPDTIDVVFQGIDLLRRLLQAVKDGGPCGVETVPVVRALSYAAKGKPAPKASAAATTTVAAPTPVKQAAPAPVAAAKPAASSAASSAASAPSAAGHDEDGKKDPKGAKKSEQSTIRVDLERLDVLVNLVGELVIDRTRFASIEEDLRTNFPQIKLGSSFSETVQLFGRHMNEIQDIIMKVRMVPIGNAFNKFTRVIRDLSRSLNKKIDLIITGEAAELDKTLVEQIGDPLIHLIRNSCDHGIELPDVRKAAGKNPTGKIFLSAHQEGNQIVIKIEDDGKGMDPAVIRRKAVEKGLISEETQLSDRDSLNLIFEAGFSTADQVTNISGRGVGMDVVKKQIMKLKGILELDSAPGRGTTTTIRLPLTLAIVQSLLVRARGETFAIPLNSVIESIRISPKEIQRVGDVEVYKLRDTVLPLIHLDEAMTLATKEGSISDLLKRKAALRRNRVKHDRLFVVVVGQPDRPTGIVVDQLLNQQEMVIKSMGPLMRNIPCVAGGAVLGHGEVVLVLDIPELEAASRGRGRMQAA
ncbi:MAG TPA: chemotaxis protein CheA [Oligoflexus sp.]|uniref:chemotaxis protein CheA n=1 Tax=Oligoflexus sp. TaxID=1971216 RepID=UPI002D240AFE|nr:chemotaxis protein CheA [Oligoflexus sp.]HYX38254.1 chemotaxis protein CheA [Oligoflexus sp.]